MPAEVKVLLQGYTNADSVAENGEEKTQPTITLVRDGDLTMVVDPGILENQQDLIDALEKAGFIADEVNIVCITHSHIDHYRNIGIFPNAKILEFFGLWDKAGCEKWPEKFSENVEIRFTPGHDYTGITVFAKTSDGVVAVCGDVFWKEKSPENAKDDPYASDSEKLEKSRHMVLQTADWIVPGHGPMYRNNKVAEESVSTVAKKVSKNLPECRHCHRPMGKLDRCKCRTDRCFNCCECGLDCDLCYCSHRT